MRRSSGLLVHAASAKRRSRLEGVSVDVPIAIRPVSATRLPSRRAVVRGLRTSATPSLAVDRSGTNRRAGPSAASIEQCVKGSGLIRQIRPPAQA